MSLIFKIVYREQRGNIFKVVVVAILFLQEQTYRTCMPVIAVYYVRLEIYTRQHLQHCLTEKHKTLSVVKMPIYTFPVKQPVAVCKVNSQVIRSVFPYKRNFCLPDDTRFYTLVDPNGKISHILQIALYHPVSGHHYTDVMPQSIQRFGQ